MVGVAQPRYVIFKDKSHVKSYTLLFDKSEGLLAHSPKSKHKSSLHFESQIVLLCLERL